MAQTQPTQSAQLFVSYSRSDRISVDKLVADLRQRNYKLWMDVDEQGINAAFERVLKSDMKYRFVIDMASLKR